MESNTPCTPYGIGKNMGVEYVGDLLGSLMHGKGMLTNICGGFRWNSYQGDFEKNKANGQGVLIPSSHLVEEYSSLMRHVTENIRPKIRNVLMSLHTTGGCAYRNHKMARRRRVPRPNATRPSVRGQVDL